MVLNDRIRHTSRKSSIGDDMLTGVIAFGWAGPEQEAEVKSCGSDQQ